MTVPSAVACTGVPVGTEISMPAWNAPSPENGSDRSSKIAHQAAIDGPHAWNGLGLEKGRGLRRENRERFALLRKLYCSSVSDTVGRSRPSWDDVERTFHRALDSVSY